MFRGGMNDWVEFVNGQFVFHSGDYSAPIRPRVTGDGAGTTSAPASGNSGIANAILQLGNQALGIWQNSQALAAQRLQAEQSGTVPGAQGQGLTGLVNQVTTFASNNPLLVAAVVAGGFLLMMNPPSKRR